MDFVSLIVTLCFCAAKICYEDIKEKVNTYL